MQELNLSDVEQVSGGFPWLAALAIADAVVDFCQGVYDGYNAK